MATCKYLDNESGSDKDDAEDEAIVVVGLVATKASEVEPASDVEPETDSKDENEVNSKTSIEELIDSLKEILTQLEHKTNELKYLKEKYVDLLKQHESTLLDLKESEKELQSFDFICRNYEGELKYLCQKLKEKCEGKSLSKQEVALEDFIISGIDRSKVASMIYSIYT